MTITSARGVRSETPLDRTRRANAADFFERKRRDRQAPDLVDGGLVSKWAVIVYIVVALATPLLIYAGPVVMPPAVPVIAGKAMSGEFTVRERLETSKH